VTTLFSRAYIKVRWVHRLSGHRTFSNSNAFDSHRTSGDRLHKKKTVKESAATPFYVGVALICYCAFSAPL
jgi:hypothetical protein